ncbi:RdRP-domain-containing protein [Irpex rosettiformis]|uniref:RdRP-domain-containing protein n=1 Tax=Irpex rosettiformis TaxID=378272 RepID=A0ACB8U9Q1_9APHY|nr:RdRP-domain-containing protein [Irpex rosettiformis]
MDWNDDVFSKEEFASHFATLGILDQHTVPELLTRTTKNTRTGNEFGFKPTALTIGLGVKHQFYSGFETDVDKAGVNVHTRENMPSSFWIRFREEWFQIRAFCSGDEDLTYAPYECRIPFRDVIPGGIVLRAKYRKGDDRVSVELMIKARRPPRYTHYLPTVLGGPIYDRHATEADFFDPPMDESDAGVVHAVEDDRLAINLGLWNTHNLALDVTARQYKLLWMCMVRLRMLNLYPDFDDATRPVLDVLPMPRWSEPGIQQLMKAQSFSIRYLVEALLTHGSLSIPELAELFSALSRMPSSRRTLVLEGLFMWTRRDTITSDLREVARRISPPKTIDTHLVMTRRCFVTPTKCILMPPVPETSNSMLRRFREHEDRFLRVQFVDEDGDFPVRGETLIIDDNLQGTVGVFARVRRALKFGIHIAGRHYVFATFSESQVRSRGCWMISESGEFTVQNILLSMGDLTTERIVAKHAARQSLALSTTRAIHMDVKVTRRYPDIERNGLYVLLIPVFTDGAGQFTQKLADECARVVGYTLTPVSAVQFRDGGVKGTLSVVNDPALEDFEIRERNSMIKIQSENRDFCVLKVATYSKATLNRQAILLMEAQGVPTQTLLNIFRAEKASIEGLQHGFAPERLAGVSVFPLLQAFRCKVKRDPFVNTIVNLVKCRLLSDLKWKAWIEIPESAFLLGVPDETDSLEEGEVFCQIHPPHGTPKIITEQCLIYRNPCLHPGDVRVVRAVDCPSLRHLRNVIVFNVRGARDLPNMYVFATLRRDGDMYSLIWDPRLIIKDAHEPMDYTGPVQAHRSNKPITIEQTKDHFVDFIKNDVLGRVCNAHLALADEHSPQDEECIELAKLASMAVDFCKTGIPVSQNEIPKIEEYPDFMGKVSRMSFPYPL